MTQEKPFAPSAERNKQAILEVLQYELTEHDRVLEYGSGTGQHLTHFATAMPNVQWIPSDLSEQLSGIHQWMNESKCKNIHHPIELDLRTFALPNIEVTACYTSNTFHIVSWGSVQQAFNCSATLLDEGEKFLTYGPFSNNGQHNSQANREFDQKLRNNNPDSGIRDLYELNILATHHGFLPARSIAMPANNQLLVWVRDKTHNT
jgi:cyclopropane fatty-acyl-phospholipid synthase-like methyltransferase